LKIKRRGGGNSQWKILCRIDRLFWICKRSAVAAEGLSAEYCKELGKIKQTKSITLWLGLKRKLPELAYIGSELYFNTDTPYWAMPISNFDPSLAPNGKQLIGFSAVFKEGDPDKQMKKVRKVILKLCRISKKILSLSMCR